MKRKVTFYRTVDGKCPVAEFIDSQPEKVALKIAWVLKPFKNWKKFQKIILRKLLAQIFTKSEFNRVEIFTGCLDFFITEIL